MRGHVGKREGKRGTSWYYMVDLGRDEATGKRRQEQKRGFRLSSLLLWSPTLRTVRTEVERCELRGALYDD